MQISMALLHKSLHMLGANIALAMPGNKVPSYSLYVVLRHFHQSPELRFVLGLRNPIDALEQFIALSGTDELIASNSAETPTILTIICEGSILNEIETRTLYARQSHSNGVKVFGSTANYPFAGSKICLLSLSHPIDHDLSLAIMGGMR